MKYWISHFPVSLQPVVVTVW